ncbi:PQQ-binding-like beta-propeller repeat protein, partial [Salmonella enterica subsp. enterica serovar Enteritidis]|uniref:outer membrane protein assembly factor BamB family protein n=1 Tax=Salmonella enterica TaxID=28901 RepID=UPI00165496B2
PGVVGGDGTFYIGNDDGNVYAVSSDGKVRWTATVGGSLISQPALGADGTLYIVSASGSLFAIGP